MKDLQNLLTLISVISLGLIQSCTHISVEKVVSKAANLIDCKYDEKKGLEFYVSKYKARYGNFCKGKMSILCEENISEINPGMKGKYLEDVKSKYSSKYYKLLLENCQTWYLKHSAFHSSFEQEVSTSREVYTYKTWNKVKSMVGKRIWLSHQYFSQGKIDELETKTELKFKHLDAVKVLEVSNDQAKYSIRSQIGPFFILVQLKNGRKGVIQYPGVDYAIHYKNPFSSKWKTSSISKIKDRKVWVGMSKEQAILSWGKPKKVNSTITARGRSEQWVYGSQYIYFRGNSLTTIQSL